MKPNLLLLHGAIGASQQLQSLANHLRENFTIHLMNFDGHGGSTNPNPFSIEAFAEQTTRYIQENGLAPVTIFGYSMGGYVALYLAAHQPQLVAGVFTLATKFLWDVETATKEVKMLDAYKIEIKLPQFAATLKERHAPEDWKVILQKTATMLQEMGSQNPLQADAYASIHQPVLLMLGDRDKMVSLEETVQVYKTLPNAQMAVLPATPHPIEQVDLEQLVFHIKQFVE